MCNIPSMQFIVSQRHRRNRELFFSSSLHVRQRWAVENEEEKNGSFKMRGKKSIYRIIMKLFLDNDHWEFSQQQQRSARLHETFWMFSVYSSIFFTFIMLPLSANQRWSDGNIAICSSIMSPHAVKHHHHITAVYQATFIRHYVIRAEEFVINHSPRSHDDN